MHVYDTSTLCSKYADVNPTLMSINTTSTTTTTTTSDNNYHNNISNNNISNNCLLQAGRLEDQEFGAEPSSCSGQAYICIYIYIYTHKYIYIYIYT